MRIRWILASAALAISGCLGGGSEHASRLQKIA